MRSNEKKPFLKSLIFSTTNGDALNCGGIPFSRIMIFALARGDDPERELRANILVLASSKLFLIMPY